MQLFYNPNISSTAKQFTFPKEESHHIVKVLRKVVDDELTITDGKGHTFVAKITDANIKACTAEVLSMRRTIPKLHSLHMAVAPTKMNDRFEWFLEKATEIGIDTITPLLCERSERKAIKMERYQKIIESAMKQSLQTFLPVLQPMTPFETFVAQEHPNYKFIAHCGEEERFDLKRRVAPDKDLVVLIGPEGDFSPHEIKLARTNGFTPISLGKTRLRTETAAIVACTTVALLNR